MYVCYSTFAHNLEALLSLYSGITQIKHPLALGDSMQPETNASVGYVFGGNANCL